MAAGKITSGDFSSLLDIRSLQFGAVVLREDMYVDVLLTGAENVE